MRNAQTLQSPEPVQAPVPSNMAPPEPPRRGRPRRTVASRFKGFDDDDDFETPMSSVAESMVVDTAQMVESQSQGLFVSQDPDSDVHRELPQPPERPTRSSRKRPAPIEEEDIMESMAPAAAGLKRRRLAEETARKRRGESTPPPPPVPKEKPLVATESRKKVKPEIDVMEVARQQREKAEALAKAEREALVRDLDGMDIEAIRDLAIIEEMEVKRAKPPPRTAARADESERWDDKWNGRKNFKKFRRRGVEGGNERGMNKVIVALEEVKRKDFGIGDDYWLEGGEDSQRRKRKGKGKETQDAIQPQSQSQPQSKNMGKSWAAERASEILASEVEDDLNHAEEPHAASSDVEVLELPPKPAARPQRSQKMSDKTIMSQNLPTSNKRPAVTASTKPAPAKKSRQTLIRKEESDDSDDDGLRFKFKRK
jgi:nibrin